VTTSDEAFAVVTGAGSGIGRAAAHALAKRGLRVCCVGRRAAPLEETAGLLGGAGFVVPADVGTEQGVAAVAAACAGGSVAVLVYAAAIEGILSLDETDRARFDALIATNLAGPFFLTRALRRLLGEGAGVVLVGSVSVRHGRARHAAYAASKAGMLGLTANLAVELAPHVRVNCVEPGATETPMFTQAVQDWLGAMDPTEAEQVGRAELGRVQLGRVGQPGEVAGAITYLACDATYTSGTVLACDGGYGAS
jgi:3-oxoacyl-[acyl-carrier protein] reductase